MRVDCSRLFRATPQREPGERPLRSKANQQPVGKAFLRPPAELSEATTTRSSVRSDNHQGNLARSRASLLTRRQWPVAAMGGQHMEYVRVYADEDGESHFEDVRPEVTEQQIADGVPPLLITGPSPFLR
jgi:hypothetical protein